MSSKLIKNINKHMEVFTFVAKSNTYVTRITPMTSLLNTIQSWRTNRRLKKSGKAQFADKYLRRLMLRNDQYYICDEDRKLIMAAIKETENIKDARTRLIELLSFHDLIIRGEECESTNNNIISAVYTLKKYHAHVLLDAYIELQKKVRTKRLYRFHGSKNLFQKEIRSYRELLHQEITV